MGDDTDNDTFVSLKRIARWLDTTATTVRRLLQEASVPAYRLSQKRGGTVRYRLADVQRFLEGARENGQVKANMPVLEEGSDYAMTISAMGNAGARKYASKYTQGT